MGPVHTGVNWQTWVRFKKKIGEGRNFDVSQKDIHGSDLHENKINRHGSGLNSRQNVDIMFASDLKSRHRSDFSLELNGIHIRIEKILDTNRLTSILTCNVSCFTLCCLFDKFLFITLHLHPSSEFGFIPGVCISQFIPR